MTECQYSIKGKPIHPPPTLPLRGGGILGKKQLNILNVGMANYPELMPAEDDTPEATGAASRQATAPDETGIDHQTLRKNGFE